MYPTVLQKLNAMEWLARYIEFLTPDCIAMASNYIKEHYADPRSKVTLEFMSYKHTSEAIPTVIQKLKTKDTKTFNFDIKLEKNRSRLTLMPCMTIPSIIYDSVWPRISNS